MQGAFSDIAEIKYLIESWGILRDAGRFTDLRESFSPGAIMHTSRSSGPAAEFVRNAETRGVTPGVTQHVVGGCHVEVQGDRALAETRMMVMSRRTLGGVPVDLTAVSRMFDRLVRMPGGWRILERFPLYEKETLDPVNPGDRLAVDTSGMEACPPGLRIQALMRREAGGDVPTKLLQTHGPAFDAMLQSWRTWLAGDEIDE